MLLQWPHQGAWNLMKTLFPAVSASQLALVSSLAPTREAKQRANTFIIAPTKISQVALSQIQIDVDKQAEQHQECTFKEP